MRVVSTTGLILCALVLSSQAVSAPPRVAPAPIMAPPAAPALDEQAEERLNLLEKKMDNNVIYELLDQLNQLRQEISELREIAEQQDHQMNLLTKRQRSLYQDVDRRMLELEAGSTKKSGLSSGYQSNQQSSSGLSVDNNSGSNVGLSGKEPVNAGASDPSLEYSTYTKAFNLLKEGNYTQAIVALRSFLLSYGTGTYADNAQYWLGEANYATRDYKTALVEFQKIITDYQDSPKRKDAELKIGFTYYELKDWEAARRSLESVITQYPNTTNARTAKLRLERLAREGR